MSKQQPSELEEIALKIYRNTQIEGIGWKSLSALLKELKPIANRFCSEESSDLDWLMEGNGEETNGEPRDE